MVDQILIAGITGLLIVILVSGFSVLLKINKVRKEQKIGVLQAFKQRKNKLWEIICLIIFILFVVMVVVGVTAPTPDKKVTTEVSGDTAETSQLVDGQKYVNKEAGFSLIYPKTWLAVNPPESFVDFYITSDESRHLDFYVVVKKLDNVSATADISEMPTEKYQELVLQQSQNSFGGAKIYTSPVQQKVVEGVTVYSTGLNGNDEVYSIRSFIKNGYYVSLVRSFKSSVGTTDEAFIESNKVFNSLSFK